MLRITPPFKPAFQPASFGYWYRNIGCATIRLGMYVKYVNSFNTVVQSLFSLDRHYFQNENIEKCAYLKSYELRQKLYHEGFLFKGNLYNRLLTVETPCTLFVSLCYSYRGNSRHIPPPPPPPDTSGRLR